MRHHGLVGAPPLTSIGEDRERAALFRAEALRHQIVSLRFIAGAADALPLPNCDQLSRVRDIKQLCRCFDRRVGVRRLDGAKQPGRRVARQIDVPCHRICGHNTWSLSHAIVAVQLPREARYGIFPDRELTNVGKSKQGRPIGAASLSPNDHFRLCRRVVNSSRSPLK